MNLGQKNKFLNINLLAASMGLFFSAERLFAQNLAGFRPVIVTSSAGELDLNSDRLLTEMFSGAIRESSLRTLGRDFYGVGGEGFAGTGSKGPIGFLSKLLIEMDREMAERLSSNYRSLQPPRGALKSSMMELFWTKSNTNSSSSSKNDSVSLLLRMLLANLSPGSAKANPFALELGGRMLDLQVLRDKDIPGGRAALLRESTNVLESIRKTNQNVWFPLHIGASISMDQNKTIKTRMEIVMKPSSVKTPPKEAGDVVVEGMKYEPDSDPRGVLDVIFERVYTPADVQSMPRPTPIVNLNFGPLKPNSMDVDLCIGNDCMDRADKVPTIYGRLDAGWLWNFLAGTLSLNEFRVLVNSLAVKIDDMTVVGENSELPLILRTQTWGWKVVDTKRNLRPLNPIEAIQKNLIGDSVASGLSSELKKAGDEAEQSLNAALKPIIEILQ
jgi:hypothetical protein